MTAEEKLKAIEDYLKAIALNEDYIGWHKRIENGDYEPGDGGNFDDAFEAGQEYGEFLEVNHMLSKFFSNKAET